MGFCLFGCSGPATSTSTSQQTETSITQGSGPNVVLGDSAGATVNISDPELARIAADLIANNDSARSIDLANSLSALVAGNAAAFNFAGDFGAKALDFSLATDKAALDLVRADNTAVFGTVKDALAMNENINTKFMNVVASLLGNTQQVAQDATSAVAGAYLNAGELKTGQLANAQQYIVIAGLVVIGLVAMRMFAR